MGAQPTRRRANGGGGQGLSRLVVALAALVVGAGAAWLGAAAADRSGTALGAALSGPSTVVPGRTVRFRITGFRPGANVEVVIAPTDRAGSIRIARSFRVAVDGSAALRFAMPLYFKLCDAWLNCKRFTWRAREKVVITASGYLEQARTTTSIALRGRG